MATALKDHFGPDVVIRISEMLSNVMSDFDSSSFVDQALDGFADLELTARARRISNAMATHLPADRAEALRVIVRSLGPPLSDPDDDDRPAGERGMAPFVYLPHVFFVAAHGLDHFEEAMRAQYELTRRFTAEFSIRAYLDRHPDATLRRLEAWASDPDPHVRRLVSEGTRPRLPWAPVLRRFVADPAPVLGLLDLLCDDPSRYVRRSVANNLNDISKDHPDVAVATAARWLDDNDALDPYVVRHGLRTLVKGGHAGALGLLGFERPCPAIIAASCEPTRVAIGEQVRIEFSAHNPSNRTVDALIDFRVHFVKQNGRTAPKVFKGTELRLSPDETSTFRRTVSLKVHTTRRPLPGAHEIDVLVNGEVRPGPSFEVIDPI